MLDYFFQFKFILCCCLRFILSFAIQLSLIPLLCLSLDFNFVLVFSVVIFLLINYLSFNFGSVCDFVTLSPNGKSSDLSGSVPFGSINF